MLPVLSQYSVAIFFALSLFTIGWAGWRGGAPEKATAAAMGYLVIVQASAYAIKQPRYLEVDEISLLVDLCMVVCLFCIALFANRMWPLYAAAMQLLALFFHTSRAIAPDVVGYAYSLLKSGPTGMVTLILLFGTIFHQRRQKRYGDYRQWAYFPIDDERQLRGQTNEDPYQRDLASTMARGWLEVPMVITGVLVALFAIAAFALMVDDTPAAIGAALLLFFGLSAVVFGIWWHKRETRKITEGFESFKGRWEVITEARQQMPLGAAGTAH